MAIENKNDLSINRIKIGRDLDTDVMMSIYEQISIIEPKILIIDKSDIIDTDSNEMKLLFKELKIIDFLESIISAKRALSEKIVKGMTLIGEIDNKFTRLILSIIASTCNNVLLTNAKYFYENMEQLLSDNQEYNTIIIVDGNKINNRKYKTMISMLEYNDTVNIIINYDIIPPSYQFEIPYELTSKFLKYVI